MLKFETLANHPQIKLKNYQVFEKIRSGFGGGLLTAVDINLDPVLIEAVNDENEILVVQCQVGEQKVRIINGYGPQEDDQLANRLSFWQTLEQEITAAKNSNCMVLVQMDANAKVGKNIIPADPNHLSENGRLLLDVLERQNLILANTLPECTGAITRHRVTQLNVEKSILDYVIICPKLANFLEMMIIDEERHFTLTKYASKKGTKTLIKSDHNTLYSRFFIEYKNVFFKKPREEIWNLKNAGGQEKFRNVTTYSDKLQNCFLTEKDFEDQCNQFFKSFDDTLHQCFKKIRIGGQNGKKS